MAGQLWQELAKFVRSVLPHDHSVQESREKSVYACMSVHAHVCVHVCESRPRHAHMCFNRNLYLHALSLKSFPLPFLKLKNVVRVMITTCKSADNLEMALCIFCYII